MKSSSEGSQTLGDVSATSLGVTHGLQLGTEAMLCDDATHAGTMKWSPDNGGKVLVCDGVEWASIYSPPIGSTEHYPAASCLAIVEAGDAGGNGPYWPVMILQSALLSIGRPASHSYGMDFHSRVYIALHFPTTG